MRAAMMLVAAAVGLAIGFNPGIGILLALAIVFSLAVIWDMALGICGFLLFTFVDVFSGSDVTLTKGAGALLVVAWVAMAATGRTNGRSLSASEPWLVAAVVGFVAWSALSAVWAESVGAAASSTLRLGLNALLLPIVFAGIRDRKHLEWILAVFVVGTLISVAWGLTHSVDPSGTTAGARNAAEGRLAGARAEANGLAALLVVAIVFAGALTFVWRSRPLVAPLGVAVVVIALIAHFATFSRGGLVVLFAVVLAGLIYGGRLRSVFGALSLVVVIVGWVFFATSSSGAVERLTLDNTSGRSDLWTVAGRMVDAHPVVGVGSGNFTLVERQYVLYPGTLLQDQYIIDSPHVVHNVYLHVLAEMGVVGFALFLAVLVLSLRCALRAVALFKRHRQRSLELLGRAVVLAIAGSLVHGFFSSTQYNKQIWLLLALCPVLLAIARETAEWARSADTVAPPFRG